MKQKNPGKTSSSKTVLLVLTVLIILGGAVRLYGISAPLADFHSWRQADTAAVGRNFARNGFNLLRPQYDDLSNLQSGIDNPQGLRMVEFPWYNAQFAFLYTLFPGLSLETWARLVAVAYSLLAIACIYFLLYFEAGMPAAVTGALTYAVMPGFVFFSRVILPETPALAHAIAALLLLYLAQRKKGRTSVLLYLMSVSLFAIGLLIKPTVLFYLAGAAGIFISRHSFDVVKKPAVYLYPILAIVPLVLWRAYITQFPEGIPASSWLFSQVNTFEGQKDIFLKPAFFRWMFFERINNIFLGGYLTTLFVLGFLRKNSLILWGIMLSGLLYLFTFQGGNVQHEYYQVILFPTLSVSVGLGAQLLFDIRERLYAFLVPVVISALFVASVFFSFFLVKGYYHIPADMLLMARIVKTFTSSEDRVIIDRMGDTSVLYLSDRKGSPLLYLSASQFREKGYKAILTDKQEIIAQLKKEGLQLRFENSQFALFSL